MLKRKDPPRRMTYYGIIVLTPCLMLGSLWMQGDLTPQTGSLALTVIGMLYLNLKWLQDFFRQQWRQEYEEKTALLAAQLARDDFSMAERNRLQRRLSELPERYHLVTSPEVTYRTIKLFGIMLNASAKGIRLSGRAF